MEIANSIRSQNSNRLYLPVIIISSLVFFLPNLGLVHLFDWDEINFAESAREMIVTGNYHRVQINFQPFWEKPPLFFWLQVLSMKVFGINEFAARLPNALFGAITLVTFYFIGKTHKDQRFGFTWAIAYLGTFLPHLYFKSGIIDPVFNYFIFLGIYFMYRSLLETNRRSFLYSGTAGIFIGLSNLTKGPVGLLVFLITFFIFFLLTRFKKFPRIWNILAFIFCFVVISFFWFGQEVIQNGFWFLKEFLTYQADLFLKPVAGHGEPFYYHFVVVLLGCFPISILALPVLTGSRFQRSKLKRLMKILFWVVIILFSITTTKIVHYSSLTYAPLAFMATVYIDHLYERKKKMSRWILVTLGVMGLIFSLLLTGLPLVASHKEWLIPHLKDPFAVAALQVPVHWSGLEFIIGIIYFFALVFSLVILSRGKIMRGSMWLFYSTATCLFIYLFNVVPKIEAYSQGTAISFYKSLKGQDVYVLPFGFKSYAQYFYFEKQSATKIGEAEEINFLTKGDIDKPAWFIVKITNTEFDSVCNNCKLMKQEGGLKFYKREAVQKKEPANN